MFPRKNTTSRDFPASSAPTLHPSTPWCAANTATRRSNAAALLQTEKLAAVGRLASSIAHEINNPLESVTNLLYLARQSSNTPEVQFYLDTADQELRRVSIIASQTLRFHKQGTKPQAIKVEYGSIAASKKATKGQSSLYSCRFRPPIALGMTCEL